MKNRLKLVCGTSAIIVATIGALVLTGWIFDIPFLKSVLPNLVSMKANTALGFLLCGVALWLINTNNLFYGQKTITFIYSFIVLLIGLLSFSEYIFAVNLGIDELLFKDNALLILGTSNPGRMSPNTALNFIFVGLAFLYLPGKFRITQVVSFFVTAISFFALLGYLYSVSYLTNFSSYDNKMAIHTAIGFFLLGIGILFSRPQRGLVSVILSKNSGGNIARPLIVFALIVPVLLGWMLLQGQYRGVFQSFQFGLALLVIVMIVALIVVIWWTARSLNRADKEKEKAERRLASLNKELEMKVSERTKHLDDANNTLALQNMEKAVKAAELITVNEALAFQNKENEKRAAELSIANKSLLFQNEEKEKTKHNLLQTQKRLARAQQLANMGSYEVDMVNNSHTWSDGMYDLYGINTGVQPSIELFLSFVHADDLAFSLDIIEKSFSSLGDSSFNFRFIKSDGNVRHGYTEFRFEFDESKNPLRLYGIMRDISDKQKAEEDLQHVENRFRALIEKGTDMKSLLSHDGKLMYGSPSITKVLGYTLEEFSQTSVYDFIHPDDVVAFVKNIEVMLQTPGKSFNLEQRMLHKNGHWVWCEGTSTNMLHEPGVNALVSNFRDISEKKLAEQQREFDSVNLSALINNTPDLMWSVDTDFKLITFNQPFYKSVKSLSGKLVAKGNDVFSLIFSPEQAARLKISYGRAFAGEAFTEVEYIEAPVQFWSEISYYPIRNGNKIIGTACHAHNITEQKLAELELTKMSNHLIQHNKDLEQFAYIVSHNLRAPVANILGASGRLNDPLLSKEKKVALSVGLNESVTKLDNVIKDLNNILQVKREISEIKEKVNFSKMVNDIKISIKDLIEKDNIDIKYDFSEIDECLSLKSYFYSIFYNLISNSIKYRQPLVPGVIKIKSHKVNDKIELIFTDNGRGIDLAKRGEQVFGLYKRFHFNVEGKGMGLFMVKTQVETLGGKISITSEVNKGTEFKIEL